MKMEMIDTILLARRYVYARDFRVNENKKRCAYLNSYLLINCGVEILNPEYTNDDTVKLINFLLTIYVNPGFYNNPQDTKYFSSDELLLEQVFSYYFGYGTSMKRIELFQKNLPQYVIGDEIVTRQFTIIDEAKAYEVLRDVARDLASYKTPFSDEEEAMFSYLVDEGFYDPAIDIQCRDNIFVAIKKYPEFAKKIDKKDVVKYSIRHIGVRNKTKNGIKKYLRRGRNYKEKAAIDLLANFINEVRDCPLSKRQAKYYNKIIQIITGKKGKETNKGTTYQQFIQLMKAGKTLEAARKISQEGSLFERNLRFILSRLSTKEEIEEVLMMIPNKNPTALIQFYYGLVDDDGPRTFIYNYDNHRRVYDEKLMKVKNSRKSYISKEVKDLLRVIIFTKFVEHYQSVPKLGKIYISPKFKKVALPISTSGTGRGLDVLPSGSRIPFKADFIRTFCHWRGIRDIDASVVFMEKYNEVPLAIDGESLNIDRIFSWRTFSYKVFKDACLSSGDDTSSNGVEFQDFDIEKLLKMGCRYAVVTINGYASPFNEGHIIQGLQIKNDLNTQAWDPKNIEFQIHIVGDTQAFTGFAIDLKKREIIIVNNFVLGGSVVEKAQVKTAIRYMNPHYLDFNMHFLLSQMGEVVKNKNEADIVFDDKYKVRNPRQKVVRSHDIETLVSYLNR